ncbi:MAG: valine--tRNA ligase, partial [Candidatus Krumholzibacteriota bacterium]|nr:valine--tRNA ligase [Candidatus Krumholzibacteriota bacterium]
TGFLKVTPAHDTTDFEIGLRHKMEPFVVIDRTGRMNERAVGFEGLPIAEAREKILRELEARGLLRRVEDYDHAVGHHDRCGSIIEPTVSRQWFLRMETLARPAIEAVKNDEIVFFPERWKNIYLSWMENIKDWCISRQLWWGHRIPVWYCRECAAEIVDREDPEVCPQCLKTALVQDEDVLDTWFSSWLWTFSPLGWPEDTVDLRTFHPTDVLVTGGDIIFFWVARMIMASLKFRKEIPFSSVYITGIVRDLRGRKMSKSLGNSPDPIDLIDRNGADALRFTLMMLSPPGQDLMFDEKKIEVGRHFANKVWNATRFILGQGEGDRNLFGGGNPPSVRHPVTGLFNSLYASVPDGKIDFGWADRWIISRLVSRFGEYEEKLGAFRFDEAVKTIYDFFWHEFCDWYLELSKPAFQGGGAAATGAAVTARVVLGVSMIMLHPVMPFFTEEIWSMLSPQRSYLSRYRFAGLPDDLRDRSLDENVELFREIVTSIRNLRQSFNIPPGEGIKVIINCESGRSLPQRLSPFREQIMSQARVKELDIAEDADKPGACAAAGHALIDIYLPLEGVIDLESEKARLGKDLEKLAQDCEKIDRRLKDEKFRKRAPGDVVEREKARFAEMSDRKNRIERILEDLK